MRLLLIILLAIPAWAGWPNGYAQRYTITVGAAQVPSSQTGFTQPIVGTFSWMADTGHGGQVTHTASVACSTETITCPMDLIFTSDANGSTLLHWEIESYSNTTGAIVAWVGWGANSISNGAKIYAWAGNSSVSTWQGGAIGTAWESNSKYVYHMPPGSGTPSTNDSTGANNGTTSGTVNGVAAKLDGGASVASGTDISVGSSAFTLGLRRSGTFSCWVNIASSASGSGTPCVGDYDGTVGMNLRVDQANTTATCYVYPNNQRATVTFSFSTGTWYFLTCVLDGVGGFVHIYVNGGSNTASAALGNDIGISSAPLRYGVVFGQFGNATFDEERMTLSVWSADRTTTEYNAQSAPSTFAAVTGPDAPPSSGAIRRRFIGGE